MFLVILFLIVAAVIFFKIAGPLFRGVLGAVGHFFSLLFWPIIILVLFLALLKFLLPLAVIIGLIFLVILASKSIFGGRGNSEDYQDDD